MLNGRSEVKCRCKGTNRRNRSKGGHTINTAVGPFCIYKVFSSGLEAASTGLRCISMWPRSSQRKAIIRTHLLSETSSDYIGLVRLAGVEPARPYGHKHLKLASLPVPAQPRSAVSYRPLIYYSGHGAICQLIFHFLRKNPDRRGLALVTPRR